MSSPEPQQPTQGDTSAPNESEPLLGRAGDATQQENAPMISNLWLGTGWLAQIGAFLLLGVIWSSVFTHETLPLVSPHPIIQSLGVFTVLQAILLLQPTTTPATKAMGQRGHAFLHLLSFLLFLTGTAIIETNKHVNHLAHFHSLHAILGITTVVLLAGQYTVGLAMYLIPHIRGADSPAGVRAKSIWKFHRISGYLALGLLLFTVAAAAETDYNKAVLGIRLWAVLLAEGLIVVGVVPRVHLAKMRFWNTNVNRDGGRAEVGAGVEGGR